MTILEASLRIRRPGFTLDADVVATAGVMTALYGNSGSGKSTLLRGIAGLERAAGMVAVGETTWQDDRSGIFLPTHRRRVGLVFQEPSLLAHLSVRDNLEYGWRRVAPHARRLDPEVVASEFGVTSLMSRPTAGLSGGERQRVAIARALLAHPQVLLLDEPVAALDEAGRTEVVDRLIDLVAELRLPAVYVSHQTHEVARIAGHVILLADGRVVGSGSPEAVLSNYDLSVRAGLIPGAVLTAHYLDFDPNEELTRLTCAFGELLVPGRIPMAGASVRVRVAARDVSLAPDRSGAGSILNVWPVVVLRLTAAESGQVTVTLAPAEAGTNAQDETAPILLATVTGLSCRRLGLSPGARIWARVKGAGLVP